MRKLLAAAALVAVAILVLAGCSPGGTPKAVTPETRVNFGDVPVSANMQDARLHEFTILNEGTGDLKLAAPQVKLLEGC